LDMGANTITFGTSHTDSLDVSARIRWNYTGTSLNIPGPGVTEFYGSNATTVGAGIYGNLWFTGSGTKTIAGTVNVNGSATYNALIGARVDDNLTVTGSLILNGPDLNNNGTLTNNGTVTVN
jgi:hypothetical protein